MLLALWFLGAVFCATVTVGVHLGFAAGQQAHKIIRGTPPPIASQPPPEDQWLITHRQAELAIPQRIAVQIAIAVDQAAERVDRPLASNVSTEGTDINQRDRSEAVPCTQPRDASRRLG